MVWSGEEAAKYFNVSVGEENTAVAAVQDYTKLYCKNTPEALAGEIRRTIPRTRQQPKKKKSEAKLQH